MVQPAQNLHTTEHTWNTQVILKKTIQIPSPPLPTSGKNWMKYVVQAILNKIWVHIICFKQSQQVLAQLLLLEKWRERGPGREICAPEKTSLHLATKLWTTQLLQLQICKHTMLKLLEGLKFKPTCRLWIWSSLKVTYVTKACLHIVLYQVIQEQTCIVFRIEVEGRREREQQIRIDHDNYIWEAKHHIHCKKPGNHDSTVPYQLQPTAWHANDVSFIQIGLN